MPKKGRDEKKAPHTPQFQGSAELSTPPRIAPTATTKVSKSFAAFKFPSQKYQFASSLLWPTALKLR
jgi:hypothetical protein